MPSLEREFISLTAKRESLKPWTCYQNATAQEKRGLSEPGWKEGIDWVRRYQSGIGLVPQSIRYRWTALDKQCEHFCEHVEWYCVTNDCSIAAWTLGHATDVNVDWGGGIIHVPRCSKYPSTANSHHLIIKFLEEYGAARYISSHNRELETGVLEVDRLQSRTYSINYYDAILFWSSPVHHRTEVQG